MFGAWFRKSAAGGTKGAPIGTNNLGRQSRVLYHIARKQMPVSEKTARKNNKLVRMKASAHARVALRSKRVMSEWGLRKVMGC